MEATSMAYVLVVLGGVSLQSAEPITVEQCAAFKAEQPTTLCVDVEPACGKSVGVKCLGRADLDEHKATAKKKHRAIYRSRTVRTARR